MKSIDNDTLALINQVQEFLARMRRAPFSALMASSIHTTNWTRSTDLTSLNEVEVSVISKLIELQAKGLTGCAIDTETAMRSLLLSLPALKAMATNSKKARHTPA